MTLPMRGEGISLIRRCVDPVKAYRALPPPHRLALGERLVGEATEVAELIHELWEESAAELAATGLSWEAIGRLGGVSAREAHHLATAAEKRRCPPAPAPTVVRST